MIHVTRKTDPEVLQAALEIKCQGKSGAVIFGKTVWHVGKKENGTLTPTKITTMAEFEEYFAPAGHTSVEAALRQR